MARPFLLALLFFSFSCGKTEALQRVAVTVVDPSLATATPVPRCPHESAVASKHDVVLELASPTFRTSPLRPGGFHSYTVGWEEHGEDAPNEGPLITRDDGLLRIWTPPWNCEHTNSGCYQGHWSRPAEVRFEDRLAPRDGCIAFAIHEDGGYVVAFSRNGAIEMQLYSDSGPALARERPIVLPGMRYVPGPHGEHVLVEDGGRALVRFSWKHGEEPSLVRSEVAFSEPPKAWRFFDGTTPLFVSDAKVTALDPASFTKIWERAGHVTSFYGSTIASVEPRGVRIAEIDPKTGRTRRERLVWEGNAARAYIESAGADTFLLLVETR